MGPMKPGVQIGPIRLLGREEAQLEARNGIAKTLNPIVISV